jgi:3-oxoacyl-[acyl-carrier-protein] synthase-3
MATTAAPRVRSDALPLRTFKAKGRPSAIFGMGIDAPPKVLTNFDLEKLFDTSDQWVTERTGIKSRHIAEPGTTTFSLATAASRRAIEAAGIKATDIDTIIVGTSSPDGPFPSIACRIQDELDAPGAMAYDVLAACTSFMYGLAQADALIATDRAECVLVVGAEVLSRMLDYTNEYRHTAVVFGDGAGAAIVRPTSKGAGFKAWCLGGDGRGYQQVTAGSVGPGAYVARDEKPIIDMKGPDVFRFAVDIFIRQAYAVAQEAGISVDEIDLWVPHQANRRIIEAAARRLAVPLERVVINVDRYGNTCSASIPLALKEAVDDGRIRSGDQVLMVAFGSGLTWASCLHAWP